MNILLRYKIIVIVGVTFLYFYTHAQEQVKDTLYFKLNTNYLIQGKMEKNNYYIKDGLHEKSNDTEAFYFEAIEIQHNLTAGKLINPKKYIRSSKFYNKHNKYKKLDNIGLSIYLQKFILYLVENSCDGQKFIRVYPMVEIE